MSPGPLGLEPRESTNTSAASELLAYSQVAFLRATDGERLGLPALRDRFHDWTTQGSAVLADTAAGGLRRDLSLRPQLLGAAFAAWANYEEAMEDPAAPIAPAIFPSYPAFDPRTSLRRRYRLTPRQTSAGIAQGIAPVLNYFLLTFNIRTDPSVTGPIRPLEVRARWMVSLWNPYTSALVPVDLQLEVNGLPAVRVVNDSLGGATVDDVALSEIFGSPLRISLPWQAEGRADQQSWLPGRVYGWTSRESLDKASALPVNGFASQFYIKNFSIAGQGVQRVASAATMGNTAQCHLAVGQPSQLTIQLYHHVGGSRELLARFTSPEFLPFATTPAIANASGYQFSYFFRLAESIDTAADPGAWLAAPGNDPREVTVSPAAYVPGANGNRPELYPNYSTSSFPDRLLDRSFPASAASLTGQSYNEDTPLFELPRGPLVSMGALQHLAIAGARPFTPGNSWGQAGGWNALFDRFFFSGLARGVAWPGNQPAVGLPNPFLQVLPLRVGGAAVTLADISAHEADGYSSSLLLQAGSFNVNSTRREAWVAVLRGGRQVGAAQFTALDALPSTGTGPDSERLANNLPAAAFFRFSQSAQETAKANAGYAASTSVPPAAPSVPSLANTHLFRNGIRKLDVAETLRLADEIVALLAIRMRAAGPFRSLAEFLDSSALFIAANGAQVSLLELAIEHVALNATVEEFSSQWLSQADIMTMLAPTLFARSDTFLIRTYGDIANPVTGEIEGRAWAEAVAQRTPAYIDGSQPAETPLAGLNEANRRLGRRFKIISFRWLTALDI